MRSLFKMTKPTIVLFRKKTFSLLGLGRRLMIKRSWVRIPPLQGIFHAPFIWIKAWELKVVQKNNLALLHVL